jgi:hypothetical protein
MGRLGGCCRVKDDFNGVNVVVSYLINKGDNYEDQDNSTSNCVDPPALARGGMSMGSHVTRPFSTVGAAGRIATRPRNISGNTFLPIAHDPSGSTLTGAAMNRGG